MLKPYAKFFIIKISGVIFSPSIIKKCEIIQYSVAPELRTSLLEYFVVFMISTSFVDFLQKSQIVFLVSLEQYFPRELLQTFLTISLFY